MKTGICKRCGVHGPVHMHHRKLRSQGGDNSAANLIPICPTCHSWIHENVGEAYEAGWLVKSWANPELVGFSSTSNFEADHSDLEPGKPCPSCARRIPYPKKPDSPKTKVVSIRIPIDDAEEFKALMQTAAENVMIGGKRVIEQPHWQFWILQAGMQELLAS